MLTCFVALSFAEMICLQDAIATALADDTAGPSCILASSIAAADREAMVCASLCGSCVRASVRLYSYPFPFPPP